MEISSKIYVAGHQGLVGSAIVRNLKNAGFSNILTQTKDELDLRNQQAVNNFFKIQRPDYVFLAAATVGGIKANNDYPATFIYDNLVIETNVIHAAYVSGVKKLLFLGSSCIYPRECPQPMREEYLLTGPLEPTNEPYAIAKIAGISLCQSYRRQYGVHFITAMPTNLYGIQDNFDLNNSHVIPGLIAKMVQAQEHNADRVTLWGTGKCYREFLFADDCADALIFLMHNYDGLHHVNVGTGQDGTIFELAHLIQELVGFKGELFFDASKPDGTPRKLLNVNRLHALGWKAKTSLFDGLTKTIEWYRANQHESSMMRPPLTQFDNAQK